MSENDIETAHPVNRVHSEDFKAIKEVSAGDYFQSSYGEIRSQFIEENLTSQLFANQLAEGVGFEPTVRLPVRLISSQVPSTTQPPFQPKIGQLISHV